MVLLVKEKYFEETKMSEYLSSPLISSYHGASRDFSAVRERPWFPVYIWDASVFEEEEVATSFLFNVLLRERVI